MQQLSIEITHHDEDLGFTEVLVTATNGRYSGCAIIHLDLEELVNFGNRIKEFPKYIGQVQEQEFGYPKIFQKEFLEKYPEVNEASPYSEAYVHLKLYTIDSLGHSALHVIMEEDAWSSRQEALGKASFEIRLEPAQIDIFGDEVALLGKNKMGKAILMGIDDGKDNFF